MHDIDLIPLEYHRKKLFSGWLKKALLSLLIMSGLIISLFMLIRHETAGIQQKIQQLQSKKDITNSHRVKLEQLNIQKKNLQQQLKLLAGLRSGTTAEQIFLTIDAALPRQSIWITGWKFRRAGTPVENIDKSVNTGYFIVIPQGQNSSKTKEETWKIETQMTLQGSAMDHSALSEFVLNLTRQADIEDVRVVNTQLAEINNIKLVKFSLEIVVSALQEKSDG